MLTNENKFVFFEGNFAGQRTPRQMFINFDNLKDFIKYFFWPFDQKHSIQPTNQASVNKIKV